MTLVSFWAYCALHVPFTGLRDAGTIAPGRKGKPLSLEKLTSSQGEGRNAGNSRCRCLTINKQAFREVSLDHISGSLRITAMPIDARPSTPSFHSSGSDEKTRVSATMQATSAAARHLVRRLMRR